MASTVVCLPAVVATSSRWPKLPVSSNAIPSIRPGAAIVANGRTPPWASIATTPRGLPKLIAYAVSAPKPQPRRPALASAMYASSPGFEW